MIRAMVCSLLNGHSCSLAKSLAQEELTGQPNRIGTIHRSVGWPCHPFATENVMHSDDLLYYDYSGTNKLHRKALLDIINGVNLIDYFQDIVVVQHTKYDKDNPACRMETHQNYFGNSRFWTTFLRLC